MRLTGEEQRMLRALVTSAWELRGTDDLRDAVDRIVRWNELRPIMRLGGPEAIDALHRCVTDLGRRAALADDALAQQRRVSDEEVARLVTLLRDADPTPRRKKVTA